MTSLRLRSFGLLLLAVLILAPARAVESTPATKPVMVIVHGAWGGAWQFMKVDPLLRAKGYDVRRVTLTGLGERSHLANANIGLETHIEDVVNVIKFENLHDVILVGHSYGGMVITGVADRMPDRIKLLVYLDAMLPENGESGFDVLPGAETTLMAHANDGFIIPWWVKPGHPFPLDVPQPLKTFTDHIQLTNPAAAQVPGLYILTVDPGRKPEDDEFYRCSQRAKVRGWPVLILPGDHNPQWRKPVETADFIAQALASSGR